MAVFSSWLPGSSADHTFLLRPLWLPGSLGFSCFRGPIPFAGNTRFLLWASLLPYAVSAVCEYVCAYVHICACVHTGACRGSSGGQKTQLCVGMYVHVYRRVHVYTRASHSSSGGQKNPREKILSLHYVLGFQGLSSRQQAWHQECLLAEPSPWFFVPIIPAVHHQAGFSPTSCHYGDTSSSSYLSSFQLPGT